MKTLLNSADREDFLKALRNEFLTLKEVLSITKLSRTKIYQLEKSGALIRCNNTGRCKRYTAEAILECFAPKDKCKK
jgi:predicted DNA-binding transcriptional regulator AlpA